jgi:HD-GYP domain-containing protein (c-di-GMP phosphodiesterase class II)
MRVHPNQLVPGCVVLKDVMGKSINPIIPRGTVLNPIHIKVLHYFLIDEVEVRPTLSNGERFEPSKDKENESYAINPFIKQYKDSLNNTKNLFEAWKNRVPVDIVKVRSLLLPLLGQLEAYPEVIFSLHIYGEKDDYLYHHALTTSLLSGLIAKKLNISAGERIQVALAAFLSNIGMLFIDDALMKKEGNLTKEEYAKIQKHPVLSYRLVEKISMLKYETKIAILQHHERIDGSGYPFGLPGSKIHIYAKIIAVCDMYIAMTSDRFHKSKQSPFKVIEEMLNVQFGKLDLDVVKALVSILTSFSIGTKVILSNGQVGEIVFIDDKNPTRPIVKINGEESILSLMDHPNMYISQVLTAVD